MGNVRYGRWVGGVSAALLISAALTGCVNNPGDTQGDLRKYSGPVKVKSLDTTRSEEKRAASVVPVVPIHHTGYVALNDIARAIGFRGQWLSGGRYGIGDRDARWTFKPGESSVHSGGRMIRMPAPAVKESNRLYAPVSALQALFGEVASFRSDGREVSFFPRPAARDTGADDLALPFRDARGTEEGEPRAQSRGGNEAVGPLLPGGQAGQGSPIGQGNVVGQGARGHFAGQTAQTGQSAVGSRVVQDAQKYLGVKYDFGTGKYEDTGTFDCSSFTQFIFGKYGVELPRTAEEQSRLGTAVAKDGLQAGDLLFFSVPGRFKNDATVGHVGIYMGDGKMIHSSPEPQDGVQITDINKPYWQMTFLSAKRVLS
jgi:cell wall-associated NlpC family hydrolase